MTQLTVRDLIARKGEPLHLEVLAAEQGLDREITLPAVSSPGLVLAGYTERFSSRRLYALGETEISYLGSLDPAARRVALEAFMGKDLPCVFVTKGLDPPEELLALGAERGIPVVRSSLKTAEFYRRITPYLTEVFAPNTTMHASLADVYGVGLLLTGRSGIGKSECVLDLVERGHRLVADDVVHVTQRGTDLLMGRANELNPSLAMNHYHYAWYLCLFRRAEEALVEHRRAHELDPLTPLHTTWLPAVYWFSEHPDYEEALSLARENVERYIPGVTAHYVLGETLAMMGQYEEAIAVHEELARIFPAWSAPLGETYARAGRIEDARRVLEDLEARPPSSFNANGLASLHAVLGNRDEALYWLEYEPAHAWVAWGVASESFDAFRGDPRFEAVMRRMNLQMVPGDRVPTPLPVIAPPLAGTEDTP